jgi:hypothetical protein
MKTEEKPRPTYIDDREYKRRLDAVRLALKDALINLCVSDYEDLLDEVALEVKEKIDSSAWTRQRRAEAKP